MDREDIQIADKILEVFKLEGRCITAVEIEELTINKAQAYRITTSLCNEGVAKKISLGLDLTEKTHDVIDKGGAQYIYDKEQEKGRIMAMQKEDLQLSIDERKRNAELSKWAIWISALSFLVALISLLNTFLS